MHQVVENTAVVGTEKVAEQRMAREALLATNLAHPNIIATFKICTVHAGVNDRIGATGGSANTCARSRSHASQSNILNTWCLAGPGFCIKYASCRHT